MKRLSLLIWGLIFCIGAIPAMAADCPALVRQALAATDTLCHETEKNQACYGNIDLKAKLAANTQHTTFTQPGDRIDLSAIRSLELSPMVVDTGEWGVALMNVEANRMAAQPANLTMLAFGDVMLNNDVTVSSPTNVIIGKNAVNARSAPTLNAGVIGTLKPDQTVSAVDRSSDSAWLRVKFPNSEQMGWIKTDLVTAHDDLQSLNVGDGRQPHYAPMQAFTFRTGSDGINCAEVPQNGLLIQTPEGAGEVQLWINQVIVKLGSTVYFQAQPSGDMVITTVEGHATVEAMGVTQTAMAGSQIHIQMDADMRPVAAPSVAQPYQMTDVANLPIDHLQRKITIHVPLTPSEIARNGQALLNNNSQNCPGNSCHNGTNNNNGNGNDDICPGNSCNSNGNNDNCPGNSCHNGTNNNNGNGGNNGNGNGNGHGKGS